MDFLFLISRTQKFCWSLAMCFFKVYWLLFSLFTVKTEKYINWCFHFQYVILSTELRLIKICSCWQELTGLAFYVSCKTQKRMLNVHSSVWLLGWKAVTSIWKVSDKIQTFTVKGGKDELKQTAGCTSLQTKPKGKKPTSMLIQIQCRLINL